MKALTLPSVDGVVERDPLDFNRTPAWVVELIVPLLGQPRTVLDVGCGDGAIGRVLRQKWPCVEMAGVEIHDTRRLLADKAEMPDGGWVYECVFADWLCEGWPVPWPDLPIGHELIISNPPFNAALAFLEKALGRVAPGGTVAFLLPTHWDHDCDVNADKTPRADGKPRVKYERQRFLDKLRTPDGRDGYARFPIVGGGPNPARPSFKQKGTASDRYAWFLFGEQWAGQPGRRLHAIPPEEPSGQMTLEVGNG